MRPPCEVADIVRTHRAEFVERYATALDAQRRRVLRAVENCRTSVLGGHIQACDRCGHRVISYNSCRNRHCPKCQGAARQQWLADRAAELLPVPYFHVVFTLPHRLAPLALQNQRVLYGLLFRAAAETLLEVAADPRHLGAQIGVLAVLHTWGQTLRHHPHLHCVVPGGGLSPDHAEWIRCRNNFLLPVKVLSRVFRGKFLAYLRTAFRQGRLQFHGRLAAVRHHGNFSALLEQARGSEWVVYVKPPFGGPQHVLRYLSRYTHRVAISNHRLVSITDGQVTFRWRDYAHGNKKRKMTLPAVEFLRRFCLHVLPPGFVRIRHFGFLANRFRQTLLTLCRDLLSLAPVAASGDTIRANAELLLTCPSCQKGQLHLVERIPSPLTFRRLDSS